MSRHGEIEKLLADVEPRLEALREAAMEEIRHEQQRAEANVRRYDKAVQELSRVEIKISRLSAEREQLAYRTYEAWLDTDRDLMERLRASFRDLRSILEAWRSGGLRSSGSSTGSTPVVRTTGTP
jgi:DNA repair exonuclease SbcCD ATPase subunit